MSRSSLAQNVTISEALSIKENKSYELLGFFGDRFLLLQEGINSFYLQGYDKNMYFSWDKKISLKKRRPKIIKAFKSGAHFYVLYTHRIKRELFMILEKFDGSANLIDEVEIHNFGNRPITPNFNIEISKDKKSFLVYYLENNRRFFGINFDLIQNNIVWEQDFIIEKKSGKNFDTGILLTNDHVAFIIKGFTKNRPSIKNDIEIYTIDNSNNKSFKSFTLDKQITSQAFAEYDELNKKIVIFGITNSSGWKRVNNLFQIDFFPFKDITNTYTYNLESQSFEKLFSDNGISSKIFKDYQIANIVLDTKGNPLVFFESRIEINREIEITQRHFEQKYQNNKSSYFYGNILAVKFIDGKLANMKIMEKEQNSLNDFATFSSFFIMKSPKWLKIIYNFNINANSPVYDYSITPKFDVKRDFLFSPKITRLKIRWKEAVQLSNSVLVAPSEYRNKIRVIKIEF